MKKMIFALLGILIMTSCQKENFVKNDSPLETARNGKGVVKVGKGRFKTIAEGNALVSAGQTLVIDPGTYDEQLVLKDGVTYVIDGVTIIFSEPDVPGTGIYKPTVTTNGQLVNCVITGNGTFGRINSQGSVLLVNGGSTVELSNSVLIKDDEAGFYGAKFGAVNVENGNVILNSTISSRGTSVYIRSGKVTGTVNATSSNGYGLWLAGYAADVDITGNIVSTGEYLSAIQIGSGNLKFTGTVNSLKYAGLEKSGGTAIFKNSTIESQADLPAFYSGDAVFNYGGEGLSFDNCTFKTFNENAFSINTSLPVTLITNCFANRNVSDLSLITGPGTLIIN